MEVRKTLKTGVAGRDKDFIEKDCWDEKLDGVYDVSKEVTELIHGHLLKGCWKWTGRKGVWKGTTEEATSINDVHVEESGSGDVLENAADLKAAALKEGLFAMEAVRDTHAVEALHLCFEALMEMAGFHANAPLQIMDGVDGGDEEAEDADDRVSGDESPVESDDSSIDDKARVNNYFVTPGAAASGRIVKGGAHTKTVAHTVSGQTAKPNCTGGVKGTGSLGKAKGKVGSKAKPEVGAPHSKPTAAGQEPGPTFRMDGRSERVVKAVKADLQIVEDALCAITFN